MRKTSGFTLIEILVVISIIGVLSSVVLASLNTSRARARDSIRIQSLKQIQLAMELYFSKCNTYTVRQNCTGTAYGSGGNGWFNYTGYVGAGAVSQGLIDAGVISTTIIDPSKVTTSNSVNRSGYMIQANATKYTIWANLENPTAENIATQDSCSITPGYDNYSGTYPVAARMNYCVSN